MGAGRGSLALGDPPLPIREEKLEAGQATPPRRPGLHNPLTAHVSYCCWNIKNCISVNVNAGVVWQSSYTRV